MPAMSLQRSVEGPETVQGAETKGAMLRGYVLALRRAGLYDDVCWRVSPATREALMQPPPISAWIGVAPLEEIAEVVVAWKGPTALRALTRDATMQGLAPVLRTAVEGFLRLFGVEPSTLFSRLGQLSANSVRGTEYLYTQTSPNTGELIVRYTRRSRVPWNTFISIAGGLEAVFDVCGTRGTVSDPEPVAGGAMNAARYLIEQRR